MTTDPAEAAAYIRNGGIVAFPTETVYGLGADIFNEQAVGKIFAAKRRPADNPLIAHIATIEQIGELASEVTGSARRFVEAFFPGPLTIVLKKRGEVPRVATAGLETIGIRMPRFDAAHDFLMACDTPVVAPSANVSGRPSPTTWQAVHEDLDGRIDCILQGRDTEIGIESTVVDCTSSVPMILRSGSVSIEQLREVVPETDILSAFDAENAPKSPGLKHVHYSPSAHVILMDGSGMDGDDLQASAYIGLSSPKEPFGMARQLADVEDYAHSLYEFFRECDRRGMKFIFCEPVSDDGLGAALMDRIRRAAAK
jgi:L-threonylcarbamoyladenylate synthase